MIIDGATYFGTEMIFTYETYIASRLEDGRRNVLLHMVICRISGSEVGRIYWHDSNGEIEKLWVDPMHRRKGIATALWEHANGAPGPTPQHSAWRTDDGDAWAKSFNTPLPERKQA